MLLHLSDVVVVGAAIAFQYAPMGAGTMSQSIRGLDDLDKLRHLWNGLTAQSQSPMQDYAWIRTCAQAALTAGDQLHLVTVRTPSLTALAPLVQRQSRPGRLELLGVHELHEPTDFLYASPSALIPLADVLAHLPTPLLLQRIPADSPVVSALQYAYRGRGLVVCRPMPGCPWIPLDESWLQPEQHLNAGRRSDLRRACRSAEQFGPITYDILRPTPTELPALLDEAFQVEAAGWKGQSRSALQYDAVRGPFYRRYAETACEQGILRLCFLRLGGQAVAMQLAVEHNKAFWLLKIGYDEAFARCSPGTLLLLETIRYAAAHGLHSYEFLGTPASWTRVWTLLERPCVSLWAYPARMRGVAALAVDATTAVRRKLGRVVQEWI